MAAAIADCGSVLLNLAGLAKTIDSGAQTNPRHTAAADYAYDQTYRNAPSQHRLRGDR
jgi:hypothetical protein